MGDNRKMPINRFMQESVTVSLAIWVENKQRWFLGFDCRGAMQTAWSLAGAKQYLCEWQKEHEIRETVKRLEEKGHKVSVKRIRVVM